MKNGWTIALFALTACGTTPEQLVEQALRLGNTDYRASRYADAITAYSTAPTDHRTVYNRGDAHFRSEQWTEAIEQFTAAAGMAQTPREQARAQYNLGNARTAQAHWADSLSHRATEVMSGIRIEGDAIARKVSLIVLRDSLRQEQKRLEHLIDSALTAGSEAYKSALRLTPGDELARYNLAYVQGRIAARPKPPTDDDKKKQDQEKEKALTERAKLLIKRADELVEVHQFKEALEVLQEGLRQEPSLKQKEQFMQKLGVVTKAAEAQ
jgi:tetratricopeptide (TPR) repeat protein